MRKVLAILCLIVALTGVLWEGVSLFFTIDKVEVTTEVIETSPDGKTQKVSSTTEIEQWIDIGNNVRAKVGSTLKVTKDGFETITGGYSVDSPFSAKVDHTIKWSAIFMCFVTGVYLYRLK